MIKVNNEIIKPEYFPDGTMKLNIIFFNNFVNIEWYYDSENELLQLVYIVNHIYDISSDAKVYLIMPYIPNARFDRTVEVDEVFTLRYFANIINSLKFDSVNVLDPHSHVSEALFDRLSVQVPDIYIKEVFNKLPNDTMLFFPDEGSVKRYPNLPKYCGPYAFGIKRRNWVTGKIEGLDVAGDVEKINGRNILIVDDICSKGGTFYHSALKLKELGATNIYLYVTHCENSIYDGELLKNNGLIEKIYTTDSILTNTESPKIELVEEFRKNDLGVF